MFEIKTQKNQDWLKLRHTNVSLPFFSNSKLKKKNKILTIKHDITDLKSTITLTFSSTTRCKPSPPAGKM